MIVFSDFDDTLHLRDNPELFQQNLEAIRRFRAQGNKFCLASGRNKASLSRVWPDYQKYLDYAVLEDGAVCFDHNGKIIFNFFIPKDLAMEIVETIQENFSEEAAFVYYSENTEKPTPDNAITKLRCWLCSRTVGEQALNLLRTKFGKQVQSFLARSTVVMNLPWIKDQEKYQFFIDIVSIDAGKENMITKVSTELFPEEKIIVVGDSYNDIAMIKKFDGYAMENSVEELLKIIKPGHIVKSVAELLER